MRSIKELINKSTFLTYFRDKHNIIYHKQANAPNDYIYASMIYIPAPKNLADRFQSSTGKHYVKRMVQRGAPIPNFDDIPEIKKHVLSRIEKQGTLEH